MMAAFTKMADAQATFGAEQIGQVNAHDAQVVRTDLY